MFCLGENFKKLLFHHVLPGWKLQKATVSSCSAWVKTSKSNCIIFHLGENFKKQLYHLPPGWKLQQATVSPLSSPWPSSPSTCVTVKTDTLCYRPQTFGCSFWLHCPAGPPSPSAVPAARHSPDSGTDKWITWSVAVSGSNGGFDQVVKLSHSMHICALDLNVILLVIQRNISQEKKKGKKKDWTMQIIKTDLQHCQLQLYDVHTRTIALYL